MARMALLLLVVVCSSSITFARQKSSAPSKSNPAPAASSSTAEPRSASETPEKLPVRRVVLYKNGVGYFEHLGRVSGIQDVHIDFTSAQLNDVL
jgi:cell division septation protein DedD